MFLEANGTVAEREARPSSLMIMSLQVRAITQRWTSMSTTGI